MMDDRGMAGDDEVTNALRVIYANPADERFWDALEARILAHVARSGAGANIWWAELADMMRPGLVAAAALILAASIALVRSHQLEARSAFTTVISPTAEGLESTRTLSVGDGDVAIHYLIPR